MPGHVFIATHQDRNIGEDYIITLEEAEKIVFDIVYRQQNKENFLRSRTNIALGANSSLLARFG